MIELTHNFDPRKFIWLWAKYVTGFNAAHHCTNSIRGRYSTKLSKQNSSLIDTPVLALDEQPAGSYRAIYVCGVVRRGYAKHQNYPHNVHAAILPSEGSDDVWAFDNWRMAIRNGRCLPIPGGAEDLPDRYRSCPDAYTTCRIFRWAACYFTARP